MAAIGERGAPPVDSDSDHEWPEKEPEFVIEMVDSLSQPLILPPRPQLMQPPAEAVAAAGLFHQQQPRQFTPSLLPYYQPQLEYADMPKDKVCTNCFICKIVHCILVLVCVGVTLIMVKRLPEEYKEGDGELIMVCPILIAVVALHWLMLASYDKEQC